MSVPAPNVHVEHVRTGALGVIKTVNGKPENRVCAVEFEHGSEEVPQSLLRPTADAWGVLTSAGNGTTVYPYDGWLRRERHRLIDAFRNDLALGLSNSRIEPQLHQVSVALRALEKPQPRLILADEVGLGKTIEAGLILKELRARMGAELERVLIMVPASLVTQWRFELRSKFNELFVTHDAEELARIRSQHPDENPWEVEPNVICSLQLARLDYYAADIAHARWDLVIVDEAHHARRQLA
jgi:SNF2 family DNA or RNA helicase